MTRIEVVRHGARWKVCEDGETYSEYETKEAAVSAARGLGDGAEPGIRDDDPTGLDAVQDDGAGERRDPAAGSGGTRPSERMREIQPGL